LVVVAVIVFIAIILAIIVGIRCVGVVLLIRLFRLLVASMLVLHELHLRVLVHFPVLPICLT
jgi:hypothetical protein